MIERLKSQARKIVVFLSKFLDWMNLSEDEEILPKAQEYAKTHPEFEKFLEAVLAIEDEKERKRMYRLLRSIMED